MRAVYELVTRFPDRAAHLAPLYLSDPCSTQEQITTIRTISKMSHCYELNLVMNPHTARYRDGGHSLHLEDGGSKVLRNITIRHYTEHDYFQRFRDGVSFVLPACMNFLG